MNFKSFFTLKKLGSYGKNVLIEPNVRFKNPSKISLGNNIELRQGCQLYAQDNTMDENKMNPKLRIILEDYVHIKENVNLSTYGGYIHIGKRSNIGHNCVLYGQGGIEIGEDVLVGPNCSIISGNHLFDEIGKTINKSGTHDLGIKIGNDVWIGANCVILDGLSIGDGAVIGGGSVVTKDVEPYSVCFGNPARFFRKRGEN